MLESQVRLVKSQTRIKTKLYEKFIINIPTGLAKDSQFPFKPGDLLDLRAIPEENILVIRKVPSPRGLTQGRRTRRA